jgi:hypothetical protein
MFKSASSELSGISRLACPSACTAARCAITHIGVCGHPAKTGLQTALKNDPAIMARFDEARRLLGLNRKETAA